MLTLATEDKHSAVRSAAIRVLSENSYSGMEALVTRVLKKEQAFPVISNAIKALYKSDAEKGLKATEALDAEERKAMTGTLADIYSATGKAKYLPFFEENLKTVPFYEMFNFYDKYTEIVKLQSPEKILEGAEKLAEISNSDASIYRKYSTTNSINKLKKTLMKQAEEAEVGPKKTILDEAVTNISTSLNSIITNETNKNLLARYQTFK